MFTGDGMIFAIELSFMVRALIGMIIASFVSAAIGHILTSRGITFLSAEVAHAALGGAAFGVLLQTLGFLWFDPLYGAFLFGVVSALITAYAGLRGSREQMEAAIGVSLAMSMSLAVVFLGYIRSEDMPKVWGYLVGDILLLTIDDLLFLGSMAILVGFFYILFRRELVYIAFDMESSEVLGIRAKFYHYLGILLAAIGVIVTTKTLGAILVYAFLIAPAAAANEIAKRIYQIPLITLAIALSSGVAGLALSFTVNIPASGTIGILASTAYLVAILYSRFRK